MKPAGPRSSFHDSGSQRRVDVAGDSPALLLRHEDAILAGFEDAAEEARVAAFAGLARREEALPVERVMRPHQHCPESPEVREIPLLRAPNRDGHGSDLRFA